MLNTNKAMRLVNDGQVYRVSETTFIVEGDSGTYISTLLDRVRSTPAVKGLPPVFCTCEAARHERMCSHVVAALVARDREEDADPFEGLTDESDTLQ